MAGIENAAVRVEVEHRQRTDGDIVGQHVGAGGQQRAAGVIAAVAGDVDDPKRIVDAAKLPQLERLVIMGDVSPGDNGRSIARRQCCSG